MGGVAESSCNTRRLQARARGIHPAKPVRVKAGWREAASEGAIVRRAALVPTLLWIVLAGVDVGAQGLDLRIGGFMPRMRDCGIPSSVPAEYTLFQDVC